MRAATKALIVIDVQNDFCPGGLLAVGGGDEVVPIVNRLTDEFAVVVLTQDWHPPDTPHFKKDGGIWPVHCVEGTWGAEFRPDLVVGNNVLAHVPDLHDFVRGIKLLLAAGGRPRELSDAAEEEIEALLHEREALHGVGRFELFVDAGEAPADAVGGALAAAAGPVLLERLEVGLDEVARDAEVAADRLPPVRASATALSQILDVLIDNALTHGTGTICVTARRIRGGAAIDVADEGSAAAAGTDEQVFARGHGSNSHDSAARLRARR